MKDILDFVLPSRYHVQDIRVLVPCGCELAVGSPLLSGCHVRVPFSQVMFGVDATESGNCTRSQICQYYHKSLTRERVKRQWVRVLGLNFWDSCNQRNNARETLCHILCA